MIDVNDVVARLEELGNKHGAILYKVGASEKSDSLYPVFHFPKEVSKEYGLTETFNILIRVSNHFNDHNTLDRLSADLFINISGCDDLDGALSEFVDYLKNCKTEYTE